MEYEFNKVFSIENIYNSAKKCYKGVGWKGTVQLYKIHEFTNVIRTYNLLQKEKFRTGNFFKFPLMERGKLRNIQSVGISERVVQRCICDNCLVPLLSHKFIYDNTACQKGKGVHFTLDRIRNCLIKYYKAYGTKGYVFQFDFHHYFETIPHQQLIDSVDKVVNDKKIMKLYAKLVNDFDGDIGIGLGSQISQISALFYPNKIDHAFSRNGKVFAYFRYMDDGLIISPYKEVLEEIRVFFVETCKELQIIPNEKKTAIFELSKGFTFLKHDFRLKENGVVIIKTNSNNLEKNKRKLRLFRRKLDDGVITWEEVKTRYKSTFGSLRAKHNYRIRKSYKNYFFKLFQKELEHDSERISLLKRHKFS